MSSDRDGSKSQAPRERKRGAGNHQGTLSPGGWFRAMRNPDALELIRANPCAFLLAYIIACRAQYRIGFNQHNLQLGESLLGDFKSYGMSERQYRTAKALLAKFRFATFKTTNRGTIGKLIDTRLFSIFRLPNDGQKDTQATDRRRTTDGQPTTTKNERAKEHKNLRANSFRGIASKAAPSEDRPDWNGLRLEQKMSAILGNEEIVRRPDWIRIRLKEHPSRLETIMDKMHCDLQEGTVIKNRGAYAETLWKISK